MSNCWGLFPVNGLISIAIVLLMLCTERRNFRDTWSRISVGIIAWNMLTLNIIGVIIIAIAFWIKIPGGYKN